jgi:hypothetical protein
MKKLFILLTVLLVVGVSCKDFLTVDEKNPNAASSVPAYLILPAALNLTAYDVNQNDNWNFISFWYGLMSCSGGYSQPAALTQYKLINGSYQGNWSWAYLNLQNYDYIIKNATGAVNNPYRAIAKIMKAYIYQYLVDSYGNIPYTEALQTDAGILKPKFDNQKTIYEDLVVQLDSAMKLIDTAPSNVAEVGDYDIVYHGDMSLWWKFANTLKLRMLINQSDMTGRSSYITGALATTPHTTADYIGVAEGAWNNPGYSQSAGKMNPFWENFYKQDGSNQADGLGYYVAGQDACDFLITTNDPRKLRFFQAYTGTSIQGNYFGALVLNLPSVTSKLGPGMLQAFNQAAPLMTDVESLFLQAEAVARGFVTGNDSNLYKAAVTQSIIYEGKKASSDLSTYVPLTAANAATYLKQPIANVHYDASSPVAIKVKQIITQKWIAANGLPVYSVWTDYRRTGYPNFLHFSQDAARQSDTPPVRLLYPQSEINVNNDNVLLQGTINVFTSKIFWQNR